MDDMALDAQVKKLRDHKGDYEQRINAGKELLLSENPLVLESILHFFLQMEPGERYIWADFLELFRAKYNLMEIYSMAWSMSIPEMFRHKIKFRHIDQIENRIRNAYIEGINALRLSCCSLDERSGNVLCSLHDHHNVDYFDLLRLLISQKRIVLNLKSKDIHNNIYPTDYEWLRRNGFL